MQVRIETITPGPWQCATRETLLQLSRADEVGRHQVVGPDDDADLILFADLHQHGDDPHLHRLRRHPAVLSHPDKVRVIDVRDRPFFTFPGIYTSWTTKSRGSAGVAGGCYFELPTEMESINEAAQLLYSFQGARTHAVRHAILNLPARADAVVEDTTDLNFFQAAVSDEGRLASQKSYRRTMARSKFVLCPRGHGTSSFRIFETLSAGRVPVIISDHWQAPPGPDWAACSIRVAEGDVANIPRILERESSRWRDYAQASKETWSTYFGGARRWHHFVESLAGVDHLLPVSMLQREHVRLVVLKALRGAR